MTDCINAPRLIAFNYRRRFDVYAAFVKNTFLEMLAFRLRYLTGILTYMLFVSVNYFIWAAIYSGRPKNTEINGFSFSEMITYIAVGWVARSLYFSDLDYEIEDLVRSGDVSNYLLKPVDFQLMMFARACGSSAFRLLFFTVPIGLVILWIFPVMLPASASAMLLFSLSTVSGFIILAEINFIVGLLAFSIQSIQGIIRSKYFLIQLFSGLLLPMAFFPAGFRAVVELLPLKDISFVPLQFYLGHFAWGNVPSIFISQLIWISVLLVAGRLMWQRAIAKLSIQGG